MNKLNNNELDYVFDVSEKDFASKIIEASDKKLIIVDFWAPWCGPCKQLTPVLESIVRKCNGKILLAKINIDENQEIATQLRIQSIPSVFAFKNKQIVNAFQGVLPETKVVEFIEKVLGEKLEKDNSVFYNEIKELMKTEQLLKAEDLLEKFISENTQDEKAINLYLNCMISLSKFQETRDFISSLTEKMLESPELKSVITNLEIKEKNIEGPNLDAIEIKYKADQNNINIIIELSEKYFAENMIEKSFEILLEQYPKKKGKDKDKIKKIFIKYFDAMGNENENTKYFRKKFSSIMFS